MAPKSKPKKKVPSKSPRKSPSKKKDLEPVILEDNQVGITSEEFSTLLMGGWVGDGINILDRVIDFPYAITDETSTKLNRLVSVLNQASGSGRIKLMISSPGGDLDSSFSSYDTIMDSQAPVWTVARGSVCSGGTLLFLAGTVRMAYPNALFMFHSPSADMGGRLYELEESIQSINMRMKQMCDIYAERTGHETSKWWAKFLRHQDRWITAEEALSMGIIHSIIKPGA